MQTIKTTTFAFAQTWKIEVTDRMQRKQSFKWQRLRQINSSAENCKQVFEINLKIFL